MSTHVTYFHSRLYIAYYDVMNWTFEHSYDLTSSFLGTVLYDNLHSDKEERKKKHLYNI